MPRLRAEHSGVHLHGVFDIEREWRRKRWGDAYRLIRISNERVRVFRGLGFGAHFAANGHWKYMSGGAVLAPFDCPDR
jgi:hypothetical protein